MDSFQIKTRFFNRLFNVRSNEWRGIVISWLLRFFYRLSFVILWTVTLGHFVNLYGISSLPLLFVFTGFFTIVGSFLFGTFVSKFSDQALMLILLFGVSGSLLAVNLSLSIDSTYFVGSLVLVIALFLNQFRLSLISYTETFFTPQQSERTFPVIESADTLAGFLGGIVIFTSIESIGVQGLLYVVVVSMLLIAPYLTVSVLRKSEKLEEGDSSKDEIGLFDMMKNELRNQASSRYLYTLLVIVLLQWFIFNILEFLYTDAVYANAATVAADFGSGFEHAFIHDLGQLFSLFSSLALLFQLLIGSRLISALGVFNSVLVHVLTSLLGFVGLVFGFNFFTAVFVKNNFTVGSIIFNNAYHSSYYVLSEDIRKQAREFLEGVIRPLGAILGTLFLLAAQYLVPLEYRNYFLLFVLISVSVFQYIMVSKQRDYYTDFAASNLSSSNDLHTKLLSLDILSQKGHQRGHIVLQSIVFNPNEDFSIKKLALEALAACPNERSKSVLLKALCSEEMELKKEALLSLYNCEFSNFKDLSLTERYMIVNTLKETVSTSSENESIILIRLLRNFPEPMALDFLYECIVSGSKAIRLAAILTLGYFKDDAVNLHLQQFLSSKDFEERLYCSIALYHDTRFKNKSSEILDKAIASEDLSEVALSYFALGEMGLKKESSVLLQSLEDDDVNVRFHAALALMKLDFASGIPVMVDIVLNSSREFVFALRPYIIDLPELIRVEYDTFLKKKARREIKVILKKQSSSELEKSELMKLRWLYYIIDYGSLDSYRLNTN